MRRFAPLPILAAVLFIAGPALAHTGLGIHAGFAGGFAHPFGGLDHLLAMVAVGIWAGQIGGRALYLAPLSFIAAMALGGALGMAGIGLPLVEPGIVGSVVVFGLLIALAVRPAVGLGMAIAAVFAVFHGYAHGAEMEGTASLALYAAGFMVATGLLHLVGIGIAKALQTARQLRFERVLGVGIAAAGVLLAAA